MCRTELVSNKLDMKFDVRHILANNVVAHEPDL